MPNNWEYNGIKLNIEPYTWLKTRNTNKEQVLKH